MIIRASISFFEREAFPKLVYTFNVIKYSTQRYCKLGTWIYTNNYMFVALEFSMNLVQSYF